MKREASKALRLLGFAVRKRAVVVGRSACRESIGRGDVALLLCAVDAGDSILRDCGAGATPTLVLEVDKAGLGQRLGKGNVAIVGITDRELARGILEAWQ